MDWGEDFFMKEIKDGAAMNGELLTDQEEKVLRSGVTDVVTSGIYSQDESKKLNDKCVRALSKSYSFAIADNNVNKRLNARLWRDNNGYVYKHSKNVISGVIQNWYLSEGRRQEKETFGCLSVILFWFWILSSATLLFSFILHILR